MAQGWEEFRHFFIGGRRYHVKYVVSYVPEVGIHRYFKVLGSELRCDCPDRENAESQHARKEAMMDENARKIWEGQGLPRQDDS